MLSKLVLVILLPWLAFAFPEVRLHSSLHCPAVMIQARTLVKYFSVPQAKGNVYVLPFEDTEGLASLFVSSVKRAQFVQEFKAVFSENWKEWEVRFAIEFLRLHQNRKGIFQILGTIESTLPKEEEFIFRSIKDLPHSFLLGAFDPEESGAKLALYQILSTSKRATGVFLAKWRKNNIEEPSEHLEDVLEILFSVRIYHAFAQKFFPIEAELMTREFISALLARANTSFLQERIIGGLQKLNINHSNIIGMSQSILAELYSTYRK